MTAYAGAVSGAGLGGAIGNRIGHFFNDGCNFKKGGNDGDQGHGPGDNDIIGQVAKNNDITDPDDIHDFGDYVEESKTYDGMKNIENYNWNELNQLAQQWLNGDGPGLYPE